jgi:hypothetical protein
MAFANFYLKDVMNADSQRLIEIKETEVGKGLFAKQSIAAGTALFQVDINSRKLQFSDTKKLEGRESHALQISMDEYILLQPPVLLSNHSCDPNCGFNEYYQFITVKDIAEGEELVWDYSTSMFEHNWTMKCQCGTQLCRTIVRDFDLLPQEIQSKYLNMKIVLPYIVEIWRTRYAKTA